MPLFDSYTEMFGVAYPFFRGYVPEQLDRFLLWIPVALFAKKFLIRKVISPGGDKEVGSDFHEKYGDLLD